MDDLYFLGDKIKEIRTALEQPQTVPEFQKLLDQLHEVQKECPHWEIWKKPDPQIPKEFHCSFCLKDWTMVKMERHSAKTVTAP